MSLAEFDARIVNGKVRWRRPDLAKEFVESLEGQRVTILFEEPDRSLRENRLLHALFKALSRHTGYSPKAWKDYLKEIYMSDPENGTSSMGIYECSEFIEFIQAYAATERGIVL